MAPPANLTGRWVGEYLQSGRAAPIEAELEISPDGRLTGTMRDVQTDQDLSVFEATASAGLPPGSDEQIEETLRKLLADRAEGPIRYVSHLPTGSGLEGRVEGASVTFLKTYQGEHYAGYKVGEILVGDRTANHSVHYRGRLAPDGRTIEGRWWIESDPELGTQRSEGSFLLQRQDGPRD